MNDNYNYYLPTLYLWYLLVILLSIIDSRHLPTSLNLSIGTLAYYTLNRHVGTYFHKLSVLFTNNFLYFLFYITRTEFRVIVITLDSISIIYT